MNDWLDDEVNRIKHEDVVSENLNVRKQEISSQCPTLWEDLRSFLETDVERMNASPEILRKVGGSKVIFDGTNTEILVVHKPVLPSVRMTITREYMSVSVVRVITPNGDEPERESERLRCDLDQSGNVCYRTTNDQWLSAKHASGYILRSILRPA